MYTQPSDGEISLIRDNDDDACPQIQMYRGRTVEVRNMMRVLRSCTNWRWMRGKWGSLVQDSVMSEVAARTVGDDTAVPAILFPPIHHPHHPPIVISTKDLTFSSRDRLENNGNPDRASLRDSQCMPLLALKSSNGRMDP